MKQITLLLVSAVFLLGASLAQAASVEYNFTGTVYFDNGDGSQLGQTFNVWVELDRDLLGTPATAARFDIGTLAPVTMNVLSTNNYGLIAGVESINISGTDPVSFGFTFDLDATPTGTAFAIIAGSTYQSINMTSTEFTAVPLPGAIWLLGSSMIGLLGLRKKTD